jgi:hypothetical protein
MASSAPPLRRVWAVCMLSTATALLLLFDGGAVVDAAEEEPAVIAEWIAPEVDDDAALSEPLRETPIAAEVDCTRL